LRNRKIDFPLARKIAEVMDRNAIDIVHCTLEISLLVGWLARSYSKRKPKPKLVSAMHTTLHRSRRDALISRVVYSRLRRNCDGVIFVCKAQEKHWLGKERSLAGKSVVVYNGVDYNYFSREAVPGAAAGFRQANNIPEDSRVITCIAGFRVEKGHAFLIEAFRELKENAFLVLAGDGVLRSDIERQIKQCGVASRIILLGEVADVRSILAATDVTVIPSTAETFSMAMLESMSMGVPVVASDIGGLGEAVRNGRTGVLVESGNSAALRDALAKIIENEKYRNSLGEQARRDVVDYFSKEAMVQNTQKLLTRIGKT
jgi:glycosyltransferase involved in cell wall biosynthesis